MKKSTTHVYSRRQRPIVLHALLFLIISMPFIFSSGCATVNVGYDFPDDQVKNIQIGKNGLTASITTAASKKRMLRTSLSVLRKRIL
jgi:hypothetical protein